MFTVDEPVCMLLDCIGEDGGGGSGGSGGGGSCYSNLPSLMV